MRIAIRYLTILLIVSIAAGVTVNIVRAREKKDADAQQMAQPSIMEMQKRLSALEDIEAIKRLQIEYVDCLQKGKYDTIEDFFTQDALFEAAGKANIRKGPEEIGKVYREQLSKIHKGEEGDILTQPMIDLDGNKAKAKWMIYFFYYHPKTYQTLYFVQSWFDMDYQKVGGKWKISRINVIHHIEPPGGPPNDDTFINFLDKAQATMQEMKK
jgi:hypothetical protein